MPETYQDGFEDALDLCLSEMQNSEETKEKVATKISGYLATVRKNKVEKLKNMLSSSEKFLS